MEQIFRDPNAFSLSLSLSLSLNFSCFHDAAANLYVRDVEMIFIEDERIRALFDFCVFLYRRYVDGGLWKAVETCS